LIGAVVKTGRPDGAIGPRGVGKCPRASGKGGLLWPTPPEGAPERTLWVWRVESGRAQASLVREIGGRSLKNRFHAATVLSTVPRGWFGGRGKAGPQNRARKPRGPIPWIPSYGWRRKGRSPLLGRNVNPFASFTGMLAEALHRKWHLPKQQHPHNTKYTNKNNQQPKKKTTTTKKTQNNHQTPTHHPTPPPHPPPIHTHKTQPPNPPPPPPNTNKTNKKTKQKKKKQPIPLDVADGSTTRFAGARPPDHGTAQASNGSMCASKRAGVPTFSLSFKRALYPGRWRRALEGFRYRCATRDWATWVDALTCKPTCGGHRFAR